MKLYLDDQLISDIPDKTFKIKIDMQTIGLLEPDKPKFYGLHRLK